MMKKMKRGMVLMMLVSFASFSTQSMVSATIAEKAKEWLEKLKEEVKALPGKFKAEIIDKFDYGKETLEIKVGKGDFFAGLGYNFGFEGAGDITEPFPYLKMDAGVKKMGQYKLLRDALSAVPVPSIKEFFDRVEGLQPDSVFMFKVLALFVTALKNKGVAAAFPLPGDVPLELVMLMVRLRNTENPLTKKPYKLSDVLTKLPAKIREVAGAIKIENKSILTWLDQQYTNFAALAGRKFLYDAGYEADKDKTPTTLKEAMDRVLAIGLRMLVQDIRRAKAVYAFYPTEGKKRYEAYKTATGLAKAKAYASFIKGAVAHKYERVKGKTESVKDFVLREVARVGLSKFPQARSVAEKLFKRIGIEPSELK